MNDFLSDMEAIGGFMTAVNAFNAGSRIVTVRNYYVTTNEMITKYVMTELYVDENTAKRIKNYERFKAVCFLQIENPV